MKAIKFWIIPILSLGVLTWIWYANPFAPKEKVLVIEDSTESWEPESTGDAPESIIDTIVIYERVDVPVYIQHHEPQVTIFDWTREIMTFIIGAGNIILLIRRKNATN